MSFPKVNQKQSFLEMETVFDEWNELKKEIHREDDIEKYPKPREIWLTKM